MNHHKAHRLLAAGRKITLLGGCALSSAMIAASAQAQAPVESGANQLDELVVTGSRVTRSGFDTPTPVTVVGAAALQARGSINIADTLNEMPAFRPSATPSAATEFTGTGANLADLRGLGPNRTLVLLDGRRVVSSNLTGNVDMNLFPTMLVERAEVVTGGASAAYGSDAVAGVVNLILRRVNGFEANVQFGESKFEDNQQLLGAFAAGSGFAGGRGHITIAGEYADNQGVSAQARRPWYRDAALITNPLYTPTNGQPQRLITENARLSSASFNGLINSGPLRGIEFLPNGGYRNITYGTSVGSSYMIGGDTVNPSATKPLSYPLERLSLFARPEFDLTDAIKVSADLSYAEAKTGSPSFGFPYGAIAISADNAYLPTGVRDLMAQNGVTSFTMGKYARDIGVFDTRIDNQTYRALAALDWDLGGSWKASGYAQYGKTTSVSTNYDHPLAGNLLLATDAVRGPTGQIVCRSTLTNPGNGCVPVNLFGDGSPSAAAKEYVTGDPRSKTTIEQYVFAATVQGDLFSTWAGVVPAAFGVEHRSEKADRVVDPRQQANLFSVGNAAALAGEYDVTDVFAEVDVPLAKDMAFAQALSVNGAIRYTNYSTSGSVTTWKLGASWEPLSDLRFRGTLSRDIRAPNINELFSPETTAFFTAIDPFRNNAQAFTQRITSGNLNLQPEKSDTLTVGVVVTPSILPGLRASADFYDIQIDGAVGTLNHQQTIDRCYAGQTFLCGLLVRDAAGALVSVRSQQLNLSEVRARGVDLELSYRTPVATHGDLSFTLLSSYLDELSSDDGVTKLDLAGVVGTEFASSPHWRTTGSVTFHSGDFTGFLQGRYVGGGTYNNTYAANGVNDNSVKGQFLLNMSAAYDLELSGHRVSVYGVVNNVLNQDPPLDPGLFVYATSTNPMLYDVFGRSYTLGLRYKF